jgi:UDP-N-acetylmuramoyl-tripeptide--D-alanyl-D-alanine ligase
LKFAITMKQLLKKIIVAILTFEARLVLKKYRPKIVAVTGSVGKTSTKDALYTALATGRHVRKSEKSFNSEIGVPLTILGCRNAWSNVFAWAKNILVGLELIILRRPYPEWLVLEIGVDRPGDIRRLVRWLSADVVVVTRLPDVPVHVEFFDSPEAVIEEKSALVDALGPDGLLILNADDEKVVQLAERFRGQSVTYGFGKGSHVRGMVSTTIYKKGTPQVPDGVAMRVRVGENTLRVRIHGALGRAHLYPALSALALAAFCDIPLLPVAEAFEHHRTPPGRMRIIEGVRITLLIDDTYNSSPVAATEAIATLAELKPPARRIAVLGDMLELGRFTADEHKKLGNMAAGVVDLLVTVGLRARLIAEGALNAGLEEGKILQFEEAVETGKYLQNIIKPGDIILIKGSQSVRMERTVEELMAHPEHKTELLVRQDPEWLARA